MSGEINTTAGGNEEVSALKAEIEHLKGEIDSRAELTRSLDDKVDGYERFLSAFYNNLHIGICEFSLEWMQIIRANDAVYKLLAANEEQVMRQFGNSLMTFIHPDDRQAVMRNLNHMKRDNLPRNFECRGFDMKGNIHWVHCWVSQIEDREKKRIGMLEIVDITETKNMTDELQHINKKIPAMVMRLEVSTGLALRYCNECCYEFFGGDFTADRLFERLAPEDKNIFSSFYSKLKRGENVSCVTRFYNNKQEKRWLHVVASCIGTENSIPEYYCVMLDISEQMNISMELQQERQRYKTALQGTSDTIFDYDVAKDVLVFYGNPMNPDDSRLNRHVINRFLSYRLSNTIFSPEDIPAIREYLTGQGGNTIEARLCVDKKKKSWMWFKAEGDVLYDHDRPTKIIGKVRATSNQDHTLYSRIARQLKRDKENKYAIVRMDIDNFKLINDICGWLEGDRLLNYCSSLLKERLADRNCVFGRINADIFCILMPYKNKDELKSFADSIFSTMLGYPLDLKVVTHFGIYLVEDVNISVRIMSGWANQALKTVKGNMMMSYAFFTNEMRSKVIENKNIESQMTSALEERQFVVYLQPKYNIITNTIVGAEALIRWQHPQKGIMFPNDFVPLFEKNRFIVQLDEYIWESVCMMLREWMDRGYDIVPISVNVSRLHIYDPNFVQKLTDLLARYDIPKNLIVLEFTESVFLEDVGALYKLINDLTEKGFLISSDDFGSGYSSLNMLKDVPLYEVKLDKGFLDETVSDEKGKTVVRGVISMLNNFDVKIIAEGVESQEQADFLVSAGCSVAQGFFYSRAVDRATFERFAFGVRV